MSVVTKTALKAKYQTGDFPTQQDFIDFIDTVYPYEKYVANLTQSGTAAPTAIILENTLGEVPTWQYQSAGFYTLNSAASTLFPQTKTFVMLNSAPALTDKYMFTAWWTNTNQISILTGINSVNTNGMLTGVTSIEIRVYP